MAPRANWKGYLELSLVSCPVALFPAVSRTERISFASSIAIPAIRCASNMSISSPATLSSADEQVRGYEIGKNDYITLEESEIAEQAFEGSRIRSIGNIRATR